jgi:glutamine amidotransferase
MGLGLIEGNVRKIHSSPMIRIPHVGWNEVNQRLAHPVLKGVRNNVDFYFVHSYCFEVKNRVDIIGTSTYGDEFTSIVAQKNIIGVQFHPEKSQLNGLKIIDNFCNWDGKC